MRIVIWVAGCLLWIPVFVSGQNWQMVWSDEFEGESLDTSKWSYQKGTGTEYGLTDWGNGELQYYRENNITVSDGLLSVTAKKEFYGGKSYTSGRIRTINKGDWKYCKIEFRAKMPIGQGLWAAIWMLPTDLSYGGWAQSGEIDIVECLGQETSKVYGTLHFGSTWPRNQQKGTSYVTAAWSFSAEFHDFTLIWEEGRIRWYVDGELYQELGEGDWYSSAASFPAPFDKEFHLLINLAVGGNWPGSPSGATQFPQSMLVDYIRIYQDLPVGILQDAIPDRASNRLEQNYPNPFDTSTAITFSIKEREKVTLEVFDGTARKMDTAVDEVMQPGPHTVRYDGSGLSPGLYTYRLSTEKFQAVKQMVVFKD